LSFMLRMLSLLRLPIEDRIGARVVAGPDADRRRSRIPDARLTRSWFSAFEEKRFRGTLQERSAFDALTARLPTAR